MLFSSTFPIDAWVLGRDPGITVDELSLCYSPGTHSILCEVFCLGTSTPLPLLQSK